VAAGDGRAVLVTGASRGIGRAIAHAFAERGDRVAVHWGSSRDLAEQVLGELPGSGHVLVQADMADPDGVAAMVDRAAQELGRLDVLVNNAGVFTPRPVFEIPDSEWERLFAVNVMSGVRLSRAYGPGMVERGWGRIVFVSSESALQVPTELVHYATTKLAQLGVARGLAESVAGSGVTVNSVLPGPTRSEGLEVFLGEMGGTGDVEAAGQALIDEERPSSLIKRLGTPEEVASLIVYVVSPQASATTGAALRVDGGVVRAVA
jgi:NAD(P)-dependent dehydrogenase (short-subunit alcohol dehydrogenase family)